MVLSSQHAVFDMAMELLSLLPVWPNEADAETLCEDLGIHVRPLNELVKKLRAQGFAVISFTGKISINRRDRDHARRVGELYCELLENDSVPLSSAPASPTSGAGVIKIIPTERSA